MKRKIIYHNLCVMSRKKLPLPPFTWLDAHARVSYSYRISVIWIISPRCYILASHSNMNIVTNDNKTDNNNNNNNDTKLLMYSPFVLFEVDCHSHFTWFSFLTLRTQTKRCRRVCHDFSISSDLAREFIPTHSFLGSSNTIYICVYPSHHIWYLSVVISKNYTSYCIK